MNQVGGVLIPDKEVVGNEAVEQVVFIVDRSLERHFIVLE